MCFLKQLRADGKHGETNEGFLGFTTL